VTAIYTIGHSNHSNDEFLALLRLHNISAIVDARSAPYSRFAAQFNRDLLARLLSADQIAYLFLGDCLGARPNDPSCYRNGAVSFRRLGQMNYFQEGLDRVRAWAKRFSVALMCSEKDPIQCHRMILVSRHLRRADTLITHILEDGGLEDNRDAERRLMETLHMATADFFVSPEDLVEEAYDRQGERIAHHEDQEASEAHLFAQARG
jgi:uncharacterized protein (DUF488 family)